MKSLWLYHYIHHNKKCSSQHIGIVIADSNYDAFKQLQKSVPYLLSENEVRISPPIRSSLLDINIQDYAFEHLHPIAVQPLIKE